MIVITLTDCPPKVRGDLSKWLIEIDTGVYTGQVNAKVREQLWKRICENINTGRAVMVWSTNGEQKLDFAVHNSSWVPLDYDGIKLMLHPSEKYRQEQKEAATRTIVPKAQLMQYSRQRPVDVVRISDCIFIDLETTGFAPQRDEITEIAALHIKDGAVAGEFSALCKIGQEIPLNVVRQTGITNELLENEGRPLPEVMRELLAFVGDRQWIGHNPHFDERFLQEACERCNLPVLPPPSLDTMRLAKNTLHNVTNHKLTTLAEYFNINASGAHRALADCYMTWQVLQKLRELK